MSLARAVKACLTLEHTVFCLLYSHAGLIIETLVALFSMTLFKYYLPRT